jgi:hypothetical protein
MAFVGHRSAQTQHLVHSDSSVIFGFLFISGSKMPCGQIPIHVAAEQGAHFE